MFMVELSGKIVCDELLSEKLLFEISREHLLL